MMQGRHYYACRYVMDSSHNLACLHFWVVVVHIDMELGSSSFLCADKGLPGHKNLRIPQAIMCWDYSPFSCVLWSFCFSIPGFFKSLDVGFSWGMVLINGAPSTLSSCRLGLNSLPFSSSKGISPCVLSERWMSLIFRLVSPPTATWQTSTIRKTFLASPKNWKNPGDLISLLKEIGYLFQSVT